MYFCTSVSFFPLFFFFFLSSYSVPKDMYPSEEIQPTLLALSSLLKVLKVPKVSKCWTLLAGRSPSLSTLFESVESAESVKVLDTFSRQVPLTFDTFKKDKRDGSTFKRDKSS